MNEQSPEGSAEAFAESVQRMQSEELGLETPSSPTATVSEAHSGAVQSYDNLNRLHSAGPISTLRDEDEKRDPLTLDKDTLLNGRVGQEEVSKLNIDEGVPRPLNPALHQGDNEEEVQV
jgi:hypothetical protein